MSPAETLAAWLIFVSFILLWRYLAVSEELKEADEDGDMMARDLIAAQAEVSRLTQERNTARQQRDTAQLALLALRKRENDGGGHSGAPAEILWLTPAPAPQKAPATILTRGIVH